MEASLSYGVYGGAFTRNINIYGQPYAPAKSLTIDASNLRTFYTGDIFNPGELVLTATRANGAEESIWGGRLTFTGYDSDTAGTKTVTASSWVRPLRLKCRSRIWSPSSTRQL